VRQTHPAARSGLHSSPTCARANNVEWPVDLLFDNNASISAIEADLSATFPYSRPFTSTEYARINDGNGWFWAHNGGRKSAAFTVPDQDDEHYRLYAYSERSYTASLGYFVIGTMHKDYNAFAARPTHRIAAARTRKTTCGLTPPRLTLTGRSITTSTTS
jgi:hypothetical protein